MESLPDKWWIRLARPLFAIKFRIMRRQAQAVPLLAIEQTGPLSATVNCLDGLPMARDIRIILDRLWANYALPGRTVSMLFAVVACALAYESCEAEARELLIGHGLGVDDIEQILTHLSSPLLSEMVSLLVPLARETVWYQPAQIQRRCAQVKSSITNEQFLDFCGALSLFNALCRLGVLRHVRQ